MAAEKLFVTIGDIIDATPKASISAHLYAVLEGGQRIALPTDRIWAGSHDADGKIFVDTRAYRARTRDANEKAPEE
jgi:hypothetical protein